MDFDFYGGEKMKFITKGLYYTMRSYSYFLHSFKEEILTKNAHTRNEYNCL